MNIEYIEKILNAHGVAFKKAGDRILAAEETQHGVDGWTDVTGFSKKQLARWLGY